jgi:ankyrin repeat protein
MSSLLPPTRTPAEIQAAFFEACQSGDLGRVQKLLAAGADPNAADQYGDKALHSASSRCHLAVVKALLAAGADPDAVSHCGSTSLNFASRNGLYPVLKVLLLWGADPRLGVPFIESAKEPSAFVLTPYGYLRTLTARPFDLAEALLGFKDKSALDAKTSRGAWAIAVVRGIFFKHGASTESPVEVVPEGPAVGGAGGPGGL